MWFQLPMFIFTCAAFAILAAKDEKVQRWGYVCGLAAQPFWFYTSYLYYDLTIFVVSVFVTIQHVRGIINHFPRRRGDDL